MTSSDSLYQAALCAYQESAWKQALDLLNFLEPTQRSQVECLLIRGACLAKLGRKEEAVSVFEQLPTSAEALSWLAVLTKDSANPSVAIDYAKQAVDLNPQDPAAQSTLGNLYLWVRDPNLAIIPLQEACRLDPHRAEHPHNLAVCLLLLHRNEEAFRAFQEAIRLAPKDPQNVLALSAAYMQFGMAGQAAECLLEARLRLTENAAICSALAAAYAAMRNDDEAERYHREACRISKSGESAYGAWLLNQGRFDEASVLFNQLLKDPKQEAYGYYGLSQSRKPRECAEDERFLQAMQECYSSEPPTTKSRMYLAYGLGRILEAAKRFEQAMSYFDEANAIADRVYHAGFGIEASRFAREQQAQRDLAVHLRQEGCGRHSTETPIFIIGMIRSGTTLLDQIVSSHPMVSSGGELRFWLEESARAVGDKVDLKGLVDEYLTYAQLLAGSNSRLTDKMPLNFECAGLMHLAMPNARFLHIRRNPIDTCLSIWTTFFGQGPTFAYNKANVLAYYRAYLHSMEFWRSFIPGDRLLELDYEDLIAEPEEIIPKVIEFCGLPWDEACLHHDRNTSAINTPSRWQARQPIYKSSLERWKRYEPWLGEFAALKEEMK